MSRVFLSAVAAQTNADDIGRLAAAAKAQSASGVRVTPIYVGRIASIAHESKLRVAAVVSYPNGAAKPAIKAIEAASCVKDGADEVDVVLHVPYVIAGDADACRGELMEVVRAVRAARRETIVKAVADVSAILKLADRAMLWDSVCRATRESGADYVSIALGRARLSTDESANMIAELRSHRAGLLVEVSAESVAAADQLLATGADRIVIDL